MPENNYGKVVSTRVPDWLAFRVRSEAERKGTTVSTYLKDHLQRQFSARDPKPQSDSTPKKQRAA